MPARRVLLFGGMFAVVGLVVLPGASAGPRSSTPPPVQARLDELAATVRALGVPGYAQNVRGACADSLVVSGVTEFGGTTPLPPDARFRIGSITKTFTATVILQLVDEGVLTLDDPIAEWQPLVPDSAIITVRMLLNHTSGIFDYTESTQFETELSLNPLRVWEPQELVDIGALENPPYFPPGQGWTYSNTNYIILGLIAETETGQPIESLIAQRVIEPLGLTGTSFPTTIDVPPPATTGAIVDVATQQFELITIDPSAFWAAGAMISTSEDLARWAVALADGTLLSPETQAQRLTFVPTGIVLGGFPGFPGPTDEVGYGLGIFEFGGYLGHNGELPGYLAIAMHDPAADATIVTNQNASLLDPRAPNRFQIDLLNMNTELFSSIVGILDLCAVRAVRVEPTFTG